MSARFGLQRRLWAFFPTVLVMILPFGPATAGSHAEEASAVRTIRVPLTDEVGPVLLQAALPGGRILVQGESVSSVLIEAEASRAKRRDSETVHLLDVREHENLVVLKAPWGEHPDTIRVTVPRRTSMNLSCVMSCVIEVRDVEGELELNSSDGSVLAERISGSVIATAIDGDLTVVFDRIDRRRSMSFVTFNGDVDVTFPAGLSADLRISQALGETRSEFDLSVRERSSRMETARGGEARDMKVLEEVLASVGGGGAEIRFKTWRGDISIRRGGGSPGGTARPRR